MEGMALLRAQRGLMARVAKALDVTPGAVAQWKKIPAERVVEIEQASGIPRQKLRPDLFEQRPPSAPQATA